MAYDVTQDKILGELLGEDYPLKRILMQLARELTAARLESGKSIRGIAREIGTSTMQLYSMERGDTYGQSFRSVVNYAEALGYDLEVRLVKKEDLEEGTE